jgi:hypothetical protein
LFITKETKKFLEELKVEPVEEKTRRYKLNWLRQVTRMGSNGMPEIILNYRQNWACGGAVR